MSNGAKLPYANSCTVGSHPESRMKSPTSANPTSSLNSASLPNPSILITGNAAPEVARETLTTPKPEHSNDKGKGTTANNNTTLNSDKNKNNNNNKTNSSNSSTSSTTRNTNSGNSNQKKLNSNLSLKLGKDSKLTHQEHQCCFNQNLCLFCSKGGHVAKDCSKATSSAAKGHSTTVMDKTSEAKSGSESKNP